MSKNSIGSALWTLLAMAAGFGVAILRCKIISQDDGDDDDGVQEKQVQEATSSVEQTQQASIFGIQSHIFAHLEIIF